MEPPANTTQCTATTKAGRRCRRPAIASSGVAHLCTVHAGLTLPRGEDRRRCTATTLAGSRCRRWAVQRTDPPLCPMHAGRFAPAGDESRRCTALTPGGARCRQWAVHGSEARHGRPLCPTHARVAAGGSGWRWPGPADDAAGRRCKAITHRGRQCRNWALAGTDPPLCCGHRYPEQNNQIRHGLYRPGWGLSPLERQALAVAWRTGQPLDAEVLLARLLARAVLGYLSASTRPREQDMNGIRLLLRALGTVRRVVAARRELAQEEFTIVLPPELAHLLPEQETAPEPPLPPEVAELLEEGAEDSLVGDIGVARVATAWAFGLTMNAEQLTVPQLVPRVQLVLQGTWVIRCLLVEEFVKQPARQERAAAGPHHRRGRGRRGPYKGRKGSSRR
jgi:hypothetical protein